MTFILLLNRGIAEFARAFRLDSFHDGVRAAAVAA